MVKDTTYYDILGTPVSATEIELKKAYRKKAIQLHPDKNGNDPGAAAKFQELGQAYAVLSNPDTRKLYDEVGVAGLKENNVADRAADIDPSEFFKMIFGGDSFEEWIGKLSMFDDITQTAEILGESDDEGEDEGDRLRTENDKNGTRTTATSTDVTTTALQSATPYTDASREVHRKKNGNKKKISKEQREKLAEHHELAHQAKEERIAALSKLLLARIKSFQSCRTPEAKHVFRANLHKEFEDLKIESFGIQLLHLIGKVYAAQGSATVLACRTFGFSKIFTSVKSKGERVKGGYLIIKSALDAQASAEEMLRSQVELEQSGEALTEHQKYQQMKTERVITGKLLATAWASTQFEVNGVLNKVTYRVLNDKSLSKNERLARAEALIFIGKEMLATRRTLEEEDDARIFEEMMAEASAKKSRGKKKSSMSPRAYEQYFGRADAESSKA